MSRTSFRAKPPVRAYTDALGRQWPVAKLDALIADPDVGLTVMAGVSIGLQPDHTWNPGAVYRWAGARYPRESAAALLLLLVTRYFDTAGAHYLDRGSVR